MESCRASRKPRRPALPELPSGRFRRDGALRSLLGGDENDAVGATRPVHRGARILEHLDRLDVVRIQIRERCAAVVLRRTVEDEQRLLARPRSECAPRMRIDVPPVLSWYTSTPANRPTSMSDTVRGDPAISWSASAFVTEPFTSRLSCDPYPTLTSSSFGTGSLGPPGYEWQAAMAITQHGERIAPAERMNPERWHDEVPHDRERASAPGLRSRPETMPGAVRKRKRRAH